MAQTFKEISDDDLELALATAPRAYETDWRLRTVAERAKIVSRAATILREKADEYAGYLTLEMGKLLALLSEDDEWRSKVEELADDESARAALLELGQLVTAKKIDELQSVIAYLKENGPEFPLQFNNFT